jgi:hypothetical protein
VECRAEPYLYRYKLTKCPKAKAFPFS